MALTKLATSLTYPEISEKPHRSNGFGFPKREYGKQVIVKHTYVDASQLGSTEWTWLHYRTEDQCILSYLCEVCKELKMTLEMSMMHSSSEAIIIES